MDQAQACPTQQEGPFINFSDLVADAPVGICKYLRDGKYTLVYGNRHFYELFGYTPQQMRAELRNELVHTLSDDECVRMERLLDEQTADGSMEFYVEHRVSRRDGSVIWLLVSGCLTTHGDAPAANCAVVDITDRKHMEERLRINEERFRLALAQTDSTIFDYDIATKIMIHADKSAERYGLASETHNVPDVLVERKVIHPDSAAVFLEMYRKIRAGEPTAACVMQAKTREDRYVWCKISMTNIFGRDGQAVRAVGMLEDIDAQIRREESLRERSQRDALTGLYNKGATESKIRELLQGSGCGALFIIDIDAFKEVNDHFGHLFGDIVLSESACRIASLCRREDVIGRIGGDEFLIYLGGICEGVTAQRKAAEICAAFQAEFAYNGTHANVKCSVGLAFFPNHGATFEPLYQKADIALYEAKRRGKNDFCSYEPGMGDSMGWTPYSNTQIDEPVALGGLPLTEGPC